MLKDNLYFTYTLYKDDYVAIGIDKHLSVLLINETFTLTEIRLFSPNGKQTLFVADTQVNKSDTGSDRIRPTEKIRWESGLWNHCRIRRANPIFLFEC